MSHSIPSHELPRPLRWLLLCALPIALHMSVPAPQEPVFNGDANRHVVTSIFFRDLLVDMPIENPRQYAEDYYDQYPALGLMIWPPLFHGVAGLTMTVFGTSVLVPRLLVFASFAGAVLLLSRICRRRTSRDQSVLIAIVFATMPMVFQYSRHVMLEMPTLMLCMLSIDQFDIWLTSARRRNLYAAAVAAALAALTRFDAVLLLPVLLLISVFAGRTKQLINRHTAIAACLALAILSPTYYLIWKEMGDLHMRQAAESVAGEESSMLAPGCMTFYLSHIPNQAGWIAAFLCACGIAASFRKPQRAAAGLFAALLIGTWLTFTPLAELRSRHAIYWLPAVAWFAVTGASAVAIVLPRILRQKSVIQPFVAASVMIAVTCVSTHGSHVFRVTGYATAAQIVLNQTDPGDTVFVDAWWDGNFIYQMRHLDADRTRRIVRADKLLFEFTSVPTVDFQQFAESDSEILQLLSDAGPTHIVFEDPQPFGNIPASKCAQALIRSRPDLFEPIRKLPVECTVPGARPFQLCLFEVHRNRLREHLTALSHESGDQP